MNKKTIIKLPTRSFFPVLGLQKQTRYRAEGKNGGGDPKDPNRTSRTIQFSKNQ